MTIEVVLEEEDFDLLFASDGEEALEIARSKLPGLILLDRNMPVMDGKEVFDALRREDATCGIPVMVLSGMSPGSAHDWPGAEFIGKPFDPDDLIERVHAALKS